MLRFLNLISRVIAKYSTILEISLIHTELCPGWPWAYIPVTSGQWKELYSRILCGRVWCRNFLYDCVTMKSPHSRRIDLFWRSIHRPGTCFYRLTLTCYFCQAAEKEKKLALGIIMICLSSIFHKAQGEFEFFPLKLFSKQ